MTTPSYAKDYNPLRITDLWKYERPRDINRESRSKGKPSANSIPITLYDSVDDVNIEAPSIYAMGKKVGCSHNNVWKLYNNNTNSIVCQRYFRTKEDFIKYQASNPGIKKEYGKTKNSKIEIFDHENNVVLTFESKTAACVAIGTSYSSLYRLFNGTFKSIGQTKVGAQGRYTLVK